MSASKNAFCLGCRQRVFAEHQCRLVGFMLLRGVDPEVLKGSIEDAAVIHAESSEYHELWPEYVQ